MRVDLAWRALACAATISCPLSALEWRSTSFAGVARPLQRTVDVAFEFKNTGPEVVHFRTIETNCDCLEAAADKPSYAPGETGRLTARFTIGDRLGAYHRSITVLTSDETQPRRLAVELEVPPAVAASPLELFWNVGEARETRTVDLRVAEGIIVELQEVLATAAGFRALLEPVVAGSHYRLRVTPEVIDRPLSVAFRIRGRSADGQPVTVSTYAHIR